MPSVSGSTSLEDVVCPNATSFLRAAQGQLVSSVDALVATSGHKLSAHEDGDCLEGQDGESPGRERKEDDEVPADQRHWIRPDLPSRCSWRLGAQMSASPHSHPER